MEMQKESAKSAWLSLVKPHPRSIRNAMEDSPVSLSSKANGNAKRERLAFPCYAPITSILTEDKERQDIRVPATRKAIHPPRRMTGFLYFWNLLSFFFNSNSDIPKVFYLFSV
jgi:hypothetical protein